MKGKEMPIFDKMSNDIREMAEEKLSSLSAQGNPGIKWMNEFKKGEAEFLPPQYDVLYALLLFKILDTLESINANLKREESR